MYPRPIIAKYGRECRISDDRSTSIYKSVGSCHNWGAVPPNLPLTDWQILDTSGIVGSRDHTRLHMHSVINNRTGHSILSMLIKYRIECFPRLQSLDYLEFFST